MVLVDWRLAGKKARTRLPPSPRQNFLGCDNRSAHALGQVVYKQKKTGKAEVCTNAEEAVLENSFRQGRGSEWEDRLFSEGFKVWRRTFLV